MLTIDPVDAPGGNKIDGNSIKCAFSPSRIYETCLSAFYAENAYTARTAIPASDEQMSHETH